MQWMYTMSFLNHIFSFTWLVNVPCMWIVEWCYVPLCTVLYLLIQIIKLRLLTLIQHDKNCLSTTLGNKNTFLYFCKISKVNKNIKILLNFPHESFKLSLKLIIDKKIEQRFRRQILILWTKIIKLIITTDI